MALRQHERGIRALKRRRARNTSKSYHHESRPSHRDCGLEPDGPADSTEPGSPGLGRPGDPGSGVPCGYYPTAEAVPPPSWGPGLLVELLTVLPLLATGSLASSGAGKIGRAHV